MQESTGGLLSPVLVDLMGKRALVKVEAGTLIYAGLGEEGGVPKALCKLDQDIKFFECLVTERGRLYVVMVSEDDVISGASLGKEAWIKLFEPFKALGTVRSLSLAPGVNSDVNVFFALASHKGGKLYHYRVDQGQLKYVCVLSEGEYDDFQKLKSICDLWGSINLFYLVLEKGAAVLQHQFFVPFNNTWSEPVTLYGLDQGEVENFSTIIDSENKNYLALLLKGAKKYEIIYLKRELGGWPKGGWQRAILISQEEKKGLPVIEFFRKGYLQILYYCKGEVKLFVWRDGEVTSLQKKEVSAQGKPLLRFRTASPWYAQWSLATDSMTEEMNMAAHLPSKAEKSGESCFDGEEARDKRQKGQDKGVEKEKVEKPEKLGTRGTLEKPGRVVRPDRPARGERQERNQEPGEREEETDREEMGERRREPDGYWDQEIGYPEGVSEDLEGKQKAEHDRFVRQAVQIMQAKTDLEAALRRKDKEVAKQKSLYEGRIRLLKDQLASRQEAFKSLEAKMARQEASSMSIKVEHRAWEKEINHMKKENQGLNEQLKNKEKERRELTLQMDDLKRQLEDLQEKMTDQRGRGIMGKLGGFLKK